MYFRTSKKYRAGSRGFHRYCTASIPGLVTASNFLFIDCGPHWFLKRQKKGALRPASTFVVTNAAPNDAAEEGPSSTTSPAAGRCFLPAPPTRLCPNGLRFVTRLCLCRRVTSRQHVLPQAAVQGQGQERCRRSGGGGPRATRRYWQATRAAAAARATGITRRRGRRVRGRRHSAAGTPLRRSPGGGGADRWPLGARRGRSAGVAARRSMW